MSRLAVPLPGRQPAAGSPARHGAAGSGLVDVLLGCVVLGLAVLAWLRLPVLGERQLSAARDLQAASAAAANLAEALHAPYAAAAVPRLPWRRRLLPPAPRHADCRRQACSAAQMAEQDLSDWGELTARRLPGARAELRCRGVNDRLGATEAVSRGGAVCTLCLHLASARDGHELVLRWTVRR